MNHIYIDVWGQITSSGMHFPAISTFQNQKLSRPNHGGTSGSH